MVEARRGFECLLRPNSPRATHLLPNQFLLQEFSKCSICSPGFYGFCLSLCRNGHQVDTKHTTSNSRILTFGVRALLPLHKLDRIVWEFSHMTWWEDLQPISARSEPTEVALDGQDEIVTSACTSYLTKDGFSIHLPQPDSVPSLLTSERQMNSQFHALSS